MNYTITSPATRSAQFLVGDWIFRGIATPLDAQQAGVQQPMPPKCGERACVLCNNR